MEGKIKLIWDFHGMDAQKTAEHHVHHLEQYIQKHNLNNKISGFEHLGEMHSVAYMVVDEEEMIDVRDTLRPHRGALYNAE